MPIGTVSVAESSCSLPQQVRVSSNENIRNSHTSKLTSIFKIQIKFWWDPGSGIGIVAAVLISRLRSFQKGRQKQKQKWRFCFFSWFLVPIGAFFWKTKKKYSSDRWCNNLLSRHSRYASTTWIVTLVWSKSKPKFNFREVKFDFNCEEDWCLKVTVGR